MNFLSISGSARSASTNTILLESMAENAPIGTTITLFDALQKLPIFSPDLEADIPTEVVRFITMVSQSDGLIISSPEYVHAIPGGLKNAIDWLVSGEAIINKPVILVHASHRGEDMLSSLRLVLKTVTSNFNERLFMRFPLLSKSPTEARAFLKIDDNSQKMQNFITEFERYIADLSV
ncbi:MAG: NADPH-dependent FMN reductase [Sneathiella sp.]